jgi:hypothetical protein
VAPPILELKLLDPVRMLLPDRGLPLSKEVGRPVDEIERGLTFPELILYLLSYFWGLFECAVRPVFSAPLLFLPVFT